MVHSFSFDGINVALDVASNSVHVLDDCSYALLNGQATKDRFSETDISSATAELERLTAAGRLHSQDVLKLPKFNGRRQVKALCLHVAHDCNLRCRYCFAGTGDFGHDRSLMTWEVAKAAVDFLVGASGSRQHCEIDFFGGEPLMNLPVVKQTIDYVRDIERKTGKIFKLTLTTNAVALNDDVIKYLNSENVSLVLSIDGRKPIHDQLRPDCAGNGSYEQVLRGIKRAVESRSGKNYYVRGTFTAKNTDFFEDVIHLAEQGFAEISLEPVVTSIAELQLQSEHLPEIFLQYELLAKKLFEYWHEDNAINFFHYNIDLNNGPCIVKRISGCGAGSDYLAVDPTGKLFPCHQFVGKTEFCVGNVLDGITDHSIVEQLSAASVFSKPECGDCWAKYFCSGGCHANNYNHNSDFNKPYQLGCQMQKKRLEMALWLKAKQYLNSKIG
ncbi:MAG: thioether cross-link-forming SCIFF peptide maturase [Bacillota bacterium]